MEERINPAYWWEVKAGTISILLLSNEIVNPEQPVQVKNGEQLPQSPSLFSWFVSCAILFSGQLSNVQQGIAKSKIK